MNISLTVRKFRQSHPAAFEEAKIAYLGFSKFIVLHETLRNASEKVFSLLDTALEPSLIFVVGPTTVGKTTVRKFIEKTLIKEAMPNLPVGEIPLLSVELLSVTPRQSFDWRDVYARFLIALGDPLVNKKLNYPAGGIRRGTDGDVTAHTGSTTAALRFALEKSLNLRKPRAICIDEAHHLAQVRKGDDMLLHVELLKSMANFAKIPFILFGTYDIQPLLRLNGQLSRRSEVVHMPRYHCDHSEDEKHFCAALLALQRRLPLPNQPNLIAHRELLYKYSLGCIGLLKAWLCRALFQALMTQGDTIDIVTLKATRTPTWKCMDIIKECNNGEDKLQEKASDETALDEALKSSPPQKPPQGAPMQAKKKTGGDNAPFRRNPARDPIGKQQNAA